MVAVKLSVYVGEDRNVTIKFPDEVPVGQVDLIVQVPSETVKSGANPDRERLRTKLLAAGAILTHVDVPPGAKRLSVADRMRLGTMPPGTPTALDLINEDRGEW
jgi:hypothetical protein